jgi:hypothetical protein
MADKKQPPKQSKYQRKLKARRRLANRLGLPLTTPRPILDYVLEHGHLPDKEESN